MLLLLATPHIRITLHPYRLEVIVDDFVCYVEISATATNIILLSQDLVLSILVIIHLFQTGFLRMCTLMLPMDIGILVMKMVYMDFCREIIFASHVVRYNSTTFKCSYTFFGP